MSKVGEYVSKVVEDITDDLPTTVWVCVRAGHLNLNKRAFRTAEAAKASAQRNADSFGLPELVWEVNNHGFRSQEMTYKGRQLCYYVEELDVEK